MSEKRKNDKSKNVNLDALIPREDFAADDTVSLVNNSITGIPCSELRKSNSFLLPTIRKPDFQRETADWDTNNVVRFIKSFVDGEFIPSVILWKSMSGLIFVIDGSHRLSSLIAWVNDDYGDKQFSMDLYEGEIQEEHRKIAKETRDKVNLEIGSFSDYFDALNAKNPNPKYADKARHLASRNLPIQWVDGDLERAERSFFNINQQAVPIDDAEMELIKKRKTTVGIAARAIAKAGKGHKYWNKFSDDIQKTIEDASEKIYSLLFEPIIQRPIKTLELPLCDKSNNVLMLIFDMISLVTDYKDEVDDDGNLTIKCLKSLSKIIQTFNSNYVGSFGLHPIIYCYSHNGNFRSASFYGTLLFVKELQKNEKLRKTFIAFRHPFEDSIFNNDFIVQGIINRVRHSMRSANQICEYYTDILKAFDEFGNEQEVAEKLNENKKYKGFSPVVNNLIIETTENHSSNFTSEAKGEVYINQSYTSVPRCSICGGLLHRNSISIDHIIPKKEGGIGSVDNGQLTHPYCNTGVKN